jgi:hypothetical protein
MSYISVSVHSSEVMDQLEDCELVAEMKERNLEFSLPREVADTLLNVADYCRSQGRNDYAVRLEELRDLFR